MKKTREEVVKLMEEFLRVEQGILNLDTCIGGIDEWDSLGHFIPQSYPWAPMNSIWSTGLMTV